MGLHVPDFTEAYGTVRERQMKHNIWRTEYLLKLPVPLWQSLVSYTIIFKDTINLFLNKVEYV